MAVKIELLVNGESCYQAVSGNNTGFDIMKTLWEESGELAPLLNGALCTHGEVYLRACIEGDSILVEEKNFSYKVNTAVGKAQDIGVEVKEK